MPVNHWGMDLLQGLLLDSRGLPTHQDNLHICDVISIGGVTGCCYLELLGKLMIYNSVNMKYSQGNK